MVIPEEIFSLHDLHGTSDIEQKLERHLAMYGLDDPGATSC